MQKQKIIIIGTMHGGFTPEKDLLDVVKRYNPGRILVEITQQDIENEEVSSYPPEMRAVYNYANEADIEVRGFDVDIDIVNKPLSKEEKEKMGEKAKATQEKFFKENNLTWKDMNKSQNINRLMRELGYDKDGEIDLAKHKKRQQEMLENIKRKALSKGTTVVVTGAAHLDFFEKHLPKAQFPLRGE